MMTHLLRSRIPTHPASLVLLLAAGCAAPGSNPPPATAVSPAAMSESASAGSSATTLVVPSEAPLTSVLEALPEDVRTYNDHITTLANPAFEGRVPGSRGIEMAAQYIEYYLDEAGLQPAFPTVDTIDGTEILTPRSSWRQRFELGGRRELERGDLTITAHRSPLHFHRGTDFTVTGLGGSGELDDAPLALVGYSIVNGPDDYTNYPDETNLTGKVAVMLRYEPMDDSGRSRWSEHRRWTQHAWFQNKVNAAAERGAAAAIIINPPGVDDPRAGTLLSVRESRQAVDIPVLMLSTDAGERLVQAASGGQATLAELRDAASEGETDLDALRSSASIDVSIVQRPLVAENVGGVLPGRGELADEFIVVGAHYDHLGMGEFGSRAGAGELHPGADDNASGTAGVLLLADRLAEAYDGLPPQSDARSILFLLFSAEESGLNGSRHYVQHPIVPLDRHALMINFDMIGRIGSGGVNVSGTTSAEGLAGRLQPFINDAALPINLQDAISARSDHYSFYTAGVPVLFAIIADLHEDYHTPDDVSWKINRFAAVQLVDFFARFILDQTTDPQRLVFTGAEVEDRGGPRMGDVKVRFGISPGDYSDTRPGVLVGSVGEGTSAALGGVQPGDRLMTWNGRDIDGIREWMGMLAEHEPGDVVEVGVQRGDAMITLTVTLQERETGNR